MPISLLNTKIELKEFLPRLQVFIAAPNRIPISKSHLLLHRQAKLGGLPVYRFECSERGIWFHKGSEICVYAAQKNSNSEKPSLNANKARNPNKFGRSIMRYVLKHVSFWVIRRKGGRRKTQTHRLWKQNYLYWKERATRGWGGGGEQIPGMGVR